MLPNRQHSSPNEQHCRPDGPAVPRHLGPRTGQTDHHRPAAEDRTRQPGAPSCLFTDLAAICAHLATHGWLYADGDAQYYGTPRALFPLDLLAWVQTNCALTEGIVCAWSDHSSWIQDRASLCGVQHLRLGADAGNRLTLLTHHRHRVGLEIFGKATT